ncbi:rab9 effector protein with kelch motifs [Hippocampus comes]|uniref:Rab9 effector protein with kelch motifs n=1 Tax=Hippocampus comes TaxID=109280 RepID=A0A3Q3D3X0_HIPCM|nr:PREDICTED: rab9 effector protein with kelch motifs [Hippocampus comes]XP_019735177.1 PREDICTED: rab9 effector protein with kelch motifs [Hippocampus comes]XP_019735178.1 PREDICTED: rab9 effector protein with kelch motifs [Hippocampus comes]
MELLPVLEAQEKPKQGVWYSLAPSGRSPGVSVGHTCTYWPGDGGSGRILIVGGANPGGSFSHTHAINLKCLEWDALPWEGLKARYEHCTLVPGSPPQSLWVFGGAEQSGNHNCIQKIKVAESKALWEEVMVTGEPPSPRTYHTNSACIGSLLYVFSGGEAGASPVADQKLHVFDTVSSTWTQPETQGPQPPVRHGHVIVAASSKIYIHGGMANDDFLDDMYSLDPSNMTWELVQPEGDVPPGVAAHSAMALGNNIYILGGLTADGATNAMYTFNIEKKSWTLMKFEGDLPPNRLDHCMCLLPWKVEAVGDGGEVQTAATDPEAAPTSAPAKTLHAETIHLAFVFGGMDTQGVIHNDCVVTVVT